MKNFKLRKTGRLAMKIAKQKLLFDYRINIYHSTFNIYWDTLKPISSAYSVESIQNVIQSIRFNGTTVQRWTRWRGEKKTTL